MLLSTLVNSMQDAVLHGNDVEIGGLSMDSRKVQAKDLFFCLPGLQVDGHTFANQAVSIGACALVVERLLTIDVPQVLVGDARLACSLFAQAFFGYPAKQMIMIGATGTKGKTTTCYLIKAVADQAGRKCGLIGTAVTMIGQRVVPQGMTTPDPIDLQRLLQEMVDDGCTMCVMEISAHALYFHKIDGMVFEAGIFTNFSQDHLDDFHTMDNYFAAKQRFFDGTMCKWAAVNADDGRALQITQNMLCTTYGVSKPSDVYAREIEIREDGMSYVMEWEGLRLPLRLKLSGLFNVYNAMAAAVVCLHCGFASTVVKRGLEGVKSVPGRMEFLETNTQYNVILDYAHSPDSLENILSTVRSFTKGRIITVFGCGGGRDREKRPIMGEIAARLSDIVILTSDNPRQEVPMEIITQIQAGLLHSSTPYEILEHRYDAIKKALSIAKPLDVVILAGKGHEVYQEVQGVKRPFDEKIIVAEILANTLRDS